jgi:glycosyltransferase involved in cell wall biosynthesis
MLIPGHKAELFCIAAEEAKEMCIPIVTLGIGCLRERVEHMKTGFIANNYSQFAHYTNLLLNDNNLLLEMKKNLYKQKNKKNWSMIAKNFLINAFE